MNSLVLHYFEDLFDSGCTFGAPDEYIIIYHMNQLRPPLSTLLALLIFLCSLPGVSPACTAPKPYIFGSGCFA